MVLICLATRIGRIHQGGAMFQRMRDFCWACLFIFCLWMSPALAGAAGRELYGAGATFPQPLYNKMFEVYSRQSGAKINYEGIGSALIHRQKK